MAIGRAIVRHPKLFLMDEPLSNLDAKLRLQMRQEILRIHNAINATTIYVTHDQTEAMTMASRIVVMSKGHIQQIGEPREIYEHPKNKYVASFIGTPAMNFVDGKVNNGNIIINDKILTLDDDKKSKLSSYNEKEVCVGIRPEAIEFSDDGLFECKVDTVELVGVEKLVHFKFNDLYFIAKVKNNVNIKVNEIKKFNFKTKYLHVFDKESEEALF